MAKPPVSPENQPPLHRSDADDDDENVRQLNECSSLYLSLQVLHRRRDRHLLLYVLPKPQALKCILMVSALIYTILQECLVKTDRNWKACQSGMPLISKRSSLQQFNDFILFNLCLNYYIHNFEAHIPQIEPEFIMAICQDLCMY